MLDWSSNNPSNNPRSREPSRPLLVRWIGSIAGSNNRTLTLRRENCLVGLLVLVGQSSIRATKSAAIVGCWRVGATINDRIMRGSLALPDVSARSEFLFAAGVESLDALCRWQVLRHRSA